jgi:hypothetical protein
MVSMGLVYSIHDSTAEAAIQRMIEGAQRMIRVNNNISQEEESEIITRINPAMKRHFELEIERHCKMLQERKVS